MIVRFGDKSLTGCQQKCSEKWPISSSHVEYKLTCNGKINVQAPLPYGGRERHSELSFCLGRYHQLHISHN